MGAHAQHRAGARGQTMVEYALILALIIGVLILGMNRFKTAIDTNLLGALEQKTKEVADQIAVADTGLDGGIHSDDPGQGSTGGGDTGTPP